VVSLRPALGLFIAGTLRFFVQARLMPQRRRALAPALAEAGLETGGTWTAIPPVHLVAGRP